MGHRSTTRVSIDSYPSEPAPLLKVSAVGDRWHLFPLAKVIDDGLVQIVGSKICSRRSGRVLKRIRVTLRWQTPGCDFEDYAAETRVLSRYGCKLVCTGHAKLGAEVFVLHPESGKSIRARVLYRDLEGGSAQIALALEFIGNDNFWQIEFPVPGLVRHKLS